MADDSRKLWYSVYTGGTAPVTKFLLAPSAADSSTLMFDTSCCCAGYCIVERVASCSLVGSTWGWSRRSYYSADSQYTCGNTEAYPSIWQYSYAKATKYTYPDVSCGTPCSSMANTWWSETPESTCSCYGLFSDAHHVTLPCHTVAIQNVLVYGYMYKEVEGSSFLSLKTVIEKPVWDNITGVMQSFDSAAVYLGEYTRIPLYLANWEQGGLADVPGGTMYSAADTYMYGVVSGEGTQYAAYLYSLLDTSVFLPATTVQLFDNRCVFIKDGHVVSVELLEGGTGISSHVFAQGYARSSKYTTEYPGPNTTYFSYTPVNVMDWSAQFASDQWGDFALHPVFSPESASSFVTFYYVREGRGAMTPTSNVHMTVAPIGIPGYESVAGCPLWYFRVFLSTVYPIEDINSYNLSIAMHRTDNMNSPVSIIDFSVQPNAMLCPTWWYLIYTLRWWDCLADVEPVYAPVDMPSSYCAMQTVNSTIISKTGMPWSIGGGRYHEADEAIDESGNFSEDIALRPFYWDSDAHLYSIMSLNIFNFPSWYASDICSIYIDPSNFDIPKPDFTDEGWTCVYKCKTEASCVYPSNNIQLTSFRYSSGFLSYYSAVNPVLAVTSMVIGDNCVSYGMNAKHLDATSLDSRYWVVDSEQWSAITGCPMWSIYGFGYMISEVVGTYTFTSGNNIIECTKSFYTWGRPALLSSIYGSKFTYEGHNDLAINCSSTRPAPSFAGPGNGSSTGGWGHTNWSAHIGALYYGVPYRICDSDISRTTLNWIWSYYHYYPVSAIFPDYQGTEFGYWDSIFYLPAGVTINVYVYDSVYGSGYSYGTNTQWDPGHVAGTDYNYWREGSGGGDAELNASYIDEAVAKLQIILTSNLIMSRSTNFAPNPFSTVLLEYNGRHERSAVDVLRGRGHSTTWWSGAVGPGETAHDFSDFSSTVRHTYRVSSGTTAFGSSYFSVQYIYTKSGLILVPYAQANREYGPQEAFWYAAEHFSYSSVTRDRWQNTIHHQSEGDSYWSYSADHFPHVDPPGSDSWVYSAQYGLCDLDPQYYSGWPVSSVADPRQDCNYYSTHLVCNMLSGEYSWSQAGSTSGNAAYSSSTGNGHGSGVSVFTEFHYCSWEIIYPESSC